MRPLGDFQTRLAREFKGTNVVVYAIPKGMLMDMLSVE